MKILLVDESDMVARQLEQRLRSASDTTGSQQYVVESESDYTRALEKVGYADRYDGVVIDPYPIEESRETAMEIIRLLQGSRTATVALAATFSVEQCVECFRNGAWDFIVKARPMYELTTAIMSSLLEATRKRHVSDADAHWVGRNLAALCRDFPGQWIAVSQCQIVDYAATYELLKVKLETRPPELGTKVWRLPIYWSDDADAF